MVLIRSSLGGCGRSPRSSYCSAMNLTSSSPRFCGLLPYLNYRSEIASTTPSPEVVWPTSLQQLSCASFFNRPIDGVVWPACSRARVRWWFRSAHHRGCVACLPAGCRPEMTSTSPSTKLCGRPPCSAIILGEVRPAHLHSCLAGVSAGPRRMRICRPTVSTSPSTKLFGRLPWSSFPSGRTSTSPSPDGLPAAAMFRA